jgi:hypothetical protein
LLHAGTIEEALPLHGGEERMRWGSAVALAAFLSIGFVAAASGAGGESRRHYDREADCAVFDPAGLAADSATWDGPCVHELATGRGTAEFFIRDGNSETITTEFRGGVAQDGDARIRWADGARYEGATVGGRPEGAGVLTNAKGDRFSGSWKAGDLNGQGSVVWANGDHYDGAWLDGKAEGHGIQVWADGQKYDGAWHNDLPNGQGTVTRKDGTQYTALFVDGKRQMPPIVPPPARDATLPASPAPADVAAVPLPFLDGFAGKTLIGVDGSTVTLTAKEGSLVRVVTAPNGSTQKTAFTFLGTGLGTVSDAGDPPQVAGVFRITTTGIVTDYADGRSELLSRNGTDGLSLVLKTASGEQACTAWYPQGHLFSADERKAAVAAYARRLGLADATAAMRTGCPTPVTPAAIHTAVPPPAHRRSSHTARETAELVAPASLILPAPAANGLQTILVKPSTIHLIDQAPVADADATTPSGVAPVDERIASNCLKVDSDGSYWGFRNHCGYSVQFSYCLLHGADDMTACARNEAVPGSVSANGFGALFADNSLLEHGVDHDFRWVGCRGGAGEVSAHLDQPDPALGRCIRAIRSLARD